MFCDHYVFIAPSLTSAQIETCTAFNRNVNDQPWYMALLVTIPTFLGIFIMLKRATRSIYDMIGAPLVLVLLGVAIVGVNGSRAALYKTTKADQHAREGYLQQLAYSHAIIGGSLAVLIVLQILAENASKAVPPKNKTQ
jgi:hypothetical protein